jgi:hypothetical protein
VSIQCLSLVEIFFGVDSVYHWKKYFLAQMHPSFPKIIFNGADIFFIAQCDFPSHQCPSMKNFCTNISPYKMFFHNETPYVVDKIFFLSDILLEKNIFFSYTLVKKIFFSIDTPLRKNIFPPMYY